jgi:CDP-diacylglycerol--glycerol-3-phosphate 3-phosphatidyltransferase
VIDMRVRPRVQGLLQPAGRLLSRLGVGPTFVTLFGASITIFGAIMIGTGLGKSGAVVALIGAAIDGLDGAVARASGKVSARGAFLDASVDRVGEIAVLAGLAVAQRTDARILLLCLLALGGALLIPYMRSKAESVGLEGRGGLMGRAERVILVTVGIVAGQVEPMLWVFVVGAWFTVGQRFWSTYSRIDG